MLKTWNITVKFHDCPSHYMDDGLRYCAYENGPVYCNEAYCPIKQPPNQVVEAGQAKEISTCKVCGSDGYGYSCKHCPE